MALSVDSIKTLVQRHTDRLIGESDYTTLRRYLLKREPITEVITPIEAQVSHHYATEKQTLINQLTQEACEAQEASDAREANIDAEELVTDADLRVRITQELASLETKQRELKRNIIDQKSLLDQIYSALSYLNSQNVEVSTKIDRLFHQFPQVHVHGNHQSQIHTHNHSQPYSQIIQHSVLLITKEGLIADISAQETKLTRIKGRLNSYLDTETQTEQAIRERKKLLEVSLPEKDKNRQFRIRQRTARELAKKTAANINQLLSPENLKVLNIRISSQTAKLDIQCAKLQEMVTVESYSVYLKGLKQFFDENIIPRITLNESRALKDILDLMDRLPEMETKKAATMGAILEAQNKLDVLRLNFAKKTKQVRLANASILELQQKNQQLEDQNKQLTIKSQSLGRTQTNALYSSYVEISGSVLSGVAVGLLNAGLLSNLIISPIFFAIPGALALVALVSFTVALVTYCHKSYTDATIKGNVISISMNECQINTKQLEVTEETENSIPKLEQDIKQTQQKIDEMTNDVFAQDRAIKQQLTMAKVISVSSSNSNSFFKVASTGMLLPTAPPAEIPSDVVHLPTAPADNEDDPIPPEHNTSRTITH